MWSPIYKQMALMNVKKSNTMQQLLWDSQINVFYELL